MLAGVAWTDAAAVLAMVAMACWIVALRCPPSAPPRSSVYSDDESSSGSSDGEEEDDQAEGPHRRVAADGVLAAAKEPPAGRTASAFDSPAFNYTMDAEDDIT